MNQLIKKELESLNTILLIEFIECYIRDNFDYYKLRDVDSKYILPVLSILGFVPVDSDLIPDKTGMWKAGFSRGSDVFVKYSDEVEPHALLRELFIDCLNNYYDDRNLK